jgi:hypothetical protein
MSEAPIQFRQGRLYLARQVVERHFPGCGAVILLREAADLLVLPVRYAASGGYMLKIRNASEDRVVEGADFFRDHGLAPGAEWQGRSSWSEEAGGLRLYEVFRM